MRFIFRIPTFLFILSLALFLFHIQFPRSLNYDEFHYVPAAKKMLAQTQNSNWEHPPLAKYFIAMSIKIGGDRAVGWRLFSALFGSITILAMYYLGLALFREKTLALALALITLFNQFLYVHARIAMLDSYMIAFLMWALYCFYQAWDPERNTESVKKYLLYSAILFSLGMACKWPAAFAWIFTVGLVFSLKLVQRTGLLTGSKVDSSQSWFSSQLWEGISIWYLAATFILLPIAIYYVLHLPLMFLDYHHYSLWDIFRMPLSMYEGQLRVVRSHNYMSQWWQWPFMHRPMWYAFDREGIQQQYVRGVILLGNPFIMWLGALTMIYTAWDWIKNQSRPAFLILAFFCLYTFCWVLVPRKISFYYYYFPSAMLLGMGIVYVFYRLRENLRFQYIFSALLFLWPAAVFILYPEMRMSPYFVSTYYPVLACVGICLGLLLYRRRAGYFVQNWTLWTFVFISGVVFFHFYPIMAALKISKHAFRAWMWTRGWI